MKTREAVKILKLIIDLLESSNEAFLEDIFINKSQKNKDELSHEQIMVNLDTLIKLSSIDKIQWIDFARINNMDIEFRQKDGSRDVLGKIFKYLEKNPEAKKSFEKNAEQVSSNYSPELTNALRILLRR